MSGEVVGVTALVVLFAPLVGVKVWVAIREWNRDPSGSLVALASAAHSAVIGGAGVVALLGEPLESYIWWIVALVIMTTTLRIWLAVRYHRRRRRVQV